MSGSTLRISLIVMGLSWVIAQVLLVRELLVAFHGNELVVGLTLSVWLAGGALGSVWTGRRADRAGNAVPVFVALQIFLALSLPAAVLAGGLLRPLVGLLPGELPGPGTMAVVAGVVLLPVSAACGGLFAAGCRLSHKPGASLDASVGIVYATEAFGSVLGGIAATYALIPYLNPLRIALLVSAVNLATAPVLATGRAGSRLRSIVLLSLLALNLGLLLSSGADALQRIARRAQWGQRAVMFDRDSAYGNVTVLAEAEQHTFLLDGVPTVTVPVPDIAAVEERVHLPLLFHAQPDTVLLIGGGIGGVLCEILKHPVRWVDYVELDPLLFEGARAVGDSAITAELGAPRVHLHIADGRRFVQTASRAYDLVLVGQPPPATLAFNRFYTLECYQALRRVLRPDGLLVVPCPGSATYMGRDLRNLNAVLYNTLRSIFPHVRAIPGETVLFLASAGPDVGMLDAAALGERLGQREISTRLITPFHLSYKLDPRTADWFVASIGEGIGAGLNTDLTPVALYHVLGHRIVLLSPALHALFEHLSKLSLSLILALLVAVFLILILVLRGRPHSLRTAAPVALAATGFAGMALNVVLLLAYQTFYGVLYRQIGLFTATATMGLAVGSIAAVRLPRGRSAAAALIAVEAAVFLTSVLTPAILHLLRLDPDAWGHGVLLSLNVAVGGLVGAQFPLTARICVRDEARVAAPAGALYAADLLGAWAGALSVSAFLIPVLGLLRTCLLVAFVKALSLTLLALNQKS